MKISFSADPNVAYSPNDYSDERLGFPVYYTKMFEALEKIGCSSVNIEKSLCANSVKEFRDNLKAKYPNISNNIITIVMPYE